MPGQLSARRRWLFPKKNEITIFNFGGPLSFGPAADVRLQVRERVKDHSAAMILDFLMPSSVGRESHEGRVALLESIFVRNITVIIE